MAVIAEWRGIDELGPPAGAGKGGVHSAHQFGPEELVVLRIDPQRRNPRRLAERGEGADQRILVADVIVGARTAATGEVDRGGEPRRRIGGQRQRREAAGGDADRDHAIGGNVGPAAHGLDRRAQIAGRLPMPPANIRACRTGRCSRHIGRRNRRSLGA